MIDLYFLETNKTNISIFPRDIYDNFLTYKEIYHWYFYVWKKVKYSGGL